MGRRHMSLSPIAVGVVVALAVAGCSHTQSVDAGRTLRVALTEYRLNPQHARATAGPLTIVVENFGRLSHTLSLTRDGQPAGSTKPIAPGQSARLTITAIPGTYVMSSTLLDDQALGEYGTLSVG